MDIYKTLKIAGTVVSVIGGVCNIAVGVIGEKKQAIEIETKIAKALSKRGL